MRVAISMIITCLSVPHSAHAVSISFGGAVTATGLVSTRVGTGENPLLTENFDTNISPGSPFLPCGSDQSGQIASDVQTLDNDDNPTGSYSIKNTSLFHRRLQPGNDPSCYVVANDEDRASGFITFRSPGSTSEVNPLEYFGVYWGSVDDYNYMQFLDSTGTPISLGAADANGNGRLDGDELAALGGPQPNLTLDTYINFEFELPVADGPGERATSVIFGSDNWGFEFDNVSLVRSDDLEPLPETITASKQAFAFAALEVPAPAALTLFGLGLAVVARRRAR